MPNFSTVIETSARECPDKVAVISGETRWSYRELNEAANQVAHGLRQAGIRKGDKVALSCGITPWFPIAYYGILKTGAVVVPLNILLKHKEIAHELADSGAVAYICAEGSGTGTADQLPVGREGWAAFQSVDQCKDFWLIPNDPQGKAFDKGMLLWKDLTAGQSREFDTEQTDWNDTCAIVYTSGTTGRAKGAELTHGNTLTHCLLFKDIIGYRREDNVLVAVPLFNVYGQFFQMGAPFTVGATMVLLPRFEPGAVLQAMQDHDVNAFSGVPTMMWALLNYPGLQTFDLAKIRRNWRAGITGGMPVPPELPGEVKKVFNVELLIGFGLSETTCGACTTRYSLPSRPGSVGIPWFGVEMRVVDDDMNDVPIGQSGEVVIRGHNVMKGYYNNPEANAEAFKGGWFHSGDVGKRDEDGYFYILDRKKDMIIRSGRKIYPSEVEAELMTHPEIALAAVLGVPDAERGEEIKAYVVLKGGSTLTPEAIVAWARDSMGAHTYPRHVEIRESIPLGPTGKILKAELRRMQQDS